MPKVVVYGTLMKEENAHGLLEKSKFLGEVDVNGVLINLGPYPGYLSPLTLKTANKGIEAGIVHGEMYEVDDATIRRLDSYEGNGYLYKRVEVETSAKCTAFIYELLQIPPRWETKIIISGSWRDAETEKHRHSRPAV